MQATRALLLTDVVGSTKLAEQLGDDAMAEVWSAHDRVARDLLAAHGGREIDKSDGFLLLFAQATEAVAYARAYHAAIAPLGLQARAGVHVGSVTLRENTAADVARGAKPLEVEGLAKAVAARVMAIASGGQTLATASAAPEGALSHGRWMLTGLPDPFELFEVSGDGTPPPDAAKAWRVHDREGVWVPVREVKHSLPRERDAFVGRHADLQDLARRLEDGAALVSVLGAGGSGKTRLVTRYGWSWLGSWPGGVWFCDLCEARGPDGIVSAVAKALDVVLGKEDPVVQLGHAIAGRGRCLVVLDNFEQVARYAPETLGRWLDRAAQASFVVTTREVLNLPGEATLALAPLVEPEAVALFVARAAQAKDGFVLSDADRPAVADLVRLLDHLPLAIELAAARVRVMPPKMLLQRMSERFKLLSSAGGRHTRQATLRGALDWSWDLLTPDEQSALAQLSVFEGGFGLDAAEAVLSLSEAWPLDAVQALVDKSLARRVADDRFALLVSVQEYAAEKLEAGGGRAEAEARHGEHFAAFGAAPEPRGEAQRSWALARDLDNVLRACRRAIIAGEADRAAATLRAACAVTRTRGPVAVGAELAERVLALATLRPADRAEAARLLGQARAHQGRIAEAQASFEAALAALREIGDRRGEGAVLGALGHLLSNQGRRDEARASYDAALAAAREVGDRRAEGFVLTQMGNLLMSQDRGEEARAHLAQGLARVREVGDRRQESVALAVLGQLDHRQGRLDEARAGYDAALAAARELGDRAAEAALLGDLGNLHRDQGRLDEAGAHHEAALVTAREIGLRAFEGAALGWLGTLLFHRGRLEEARALLESAVAVNREVGNRPFEGQMLCNLALVHEGQGRQAEARGLYEEALAVARAVGNRRSEGIVGGNLANLLRVRGDAMEARLRYEEALAVHRDIGFTFGLGYWLSGLALLDAEAGDLDAALRRAEEAVAVAEPFPTVQVLARITLGRVHLARGAPALARSCLDRAAESSDAMALYGPLLAAVRALVCEAEADASGVEAALAEAAADPTRCVPGTEVGDLVARIGARRSSGPLPG